MAGFKLDKTKTNSFEVLPEGRYEVIIESGAVKNSSSGNPYIAFKLKVRNDVAGQSHGGRVVFYNLTFVDATEGIVHGFLAAIGTSEDKVFAGSFPSKELAEEIKNYAVGRAVIADVKIGQYKGADTNEVKYCVASNAGGGKVDGPFDDTATGDPFAQGAGPITISDEDLPF